MGPELTQLEKEGSFDLQLYSTVQLVQYSKMGKKKLDFHPPSGAIEAVRKELDSFFKIVDLI